MIVKTKVNLKLDDGTIVGAGTVYSDENGETMPGFVGENMKFMEVLSGVGAVEPVKILRRKAR
jgi:hypothetical protein